MQTSGVKGGLVGLAKYAAIMFLAILGGSLLLGGFYVPIKQLISGTPVDFKEHWQQIELLSRVQLSAVFAAAFTAFRYSRLKRKDKE